MLSSDYKVLRSTVIALNNFFQYSHCQVVQQFRLTPFVTTALTTFTSKHVVYPCVRSVVPKVGSTAPLGTVKQKWAIGGR